MVACILPVLVAATALLHHVNAGQGQPVVHLQGGVKVSGLVETNVQGNHVNAFLGIPYADAPIGDKRWKQSTVKTLTEDINATAYGSICHGNPASDAISGQLPNNEDCLYLNIFTPAEAKPDGKLPVMVWIHGGGYVAGAANPYDGANLLGASGQKVIIVTFNYRIGALGFFSNEEILAQGDGANFGLRDQETAFRWVKQYIKMFGGNPDDITAFAESAGAKALGHHLIARDGTQKLFHRAVLQSGGYQSAQVTATKAMQAQQSAKLAAAVGCDGVQGSLLACLRKAPARAIYNASLAFNNIPTVDGVFITQFPYLLLKQGKFSRVPTIIGSNTDDGWYFSMAVTDTSQFDPYVQSKFPLMNAQEVTRLVELYPASAFPTAHHRASEIYGDWQYACAGSIYSDLISATVSDTYRYRFNYPSMDFGIPLVLHAKDLDYVFGRTNNLPSGPDAMAVVSYFQTFWTNFAMTGSPNGAKRAECAEEQGTLWPRYNVRTKQQMILQPTLAIEADAAYMPGHSARCQFWFDFEARIAPAFV